MDGINLFRTHMSSYGRSPRERSFKNMTTDFERYFEDIPSREVVEVLTHSGRVMSIDMAFRDVSRANNRDLSDDKYIIARNEDNLDVGDYIFWRDETWMIFTKEFKTIPTYQQAKIKNANQSIKWIRNGEIVNNGVGYYAYAQNQTLYTMGVSETIYIDVPDGKMMMYMQENADTQDLRINERLIIGGKVYSVKHMDTVSRQGLVSYLLDQDRVDSEYDNMELGVADYYRYYNKEDDFRDSEDAVIENPQSNNKLSGNTSPKFGSIQTYVSDVSVVEWTIEGLLDEPSFDIVEQDEEKITIRFKDKFHFVGSGVNIIARDENDSYTILPITITKKF